MLENQIKKILLLSDDPADVSFLSEIAFMQHADLELVADPSELCSRIAQYRMAKSLLAVFADAGNANRLHQFENTLQTRLGFEVSSDLRSIVHFISGTPLLMNREVMRSPYFSVYFERIKTGFRESAEFFTGAQAYLESGSMTELSFDLMTRKDAFEFLKKSVLSQKGSVEWLVGFRSAWDRLIEEVFPARFDLSIQFFSGRIRARIRSKSAISMNSVPFERLIAQGVSVIAASDSVSLWIPVFQSVSDVPDSFRFLRWINEN